MSASTEQTQKNVKESLKSTWEQNQRENSIYNVGAEIEDLLFDEEGEPIDNETTERILRNVVEKEGAEPDEKTIDGEKRLLGTKLENEQFQEHEDFAAEIDTDYHPAQSEIATEVFQNPADMVFRTENLRYLRDQNLPEGVSSHELGAFPQLMLPGENPEHRKRSKPRYTGLRSRHGDSFGSMGWIGSTQLNTGSPVGGGLSTDEFFYSFFGPGEQDLSIQDAMPGVDAPYTNDAKLEEKDPVEELLEEKMLDEELLEEKLLEEDFEDGLHEEIEGLDDLEDYEMSAEALREFIYEDFVKESPAVLRKMIERGGDLFEEAIPTNENYGYIEDVSEVQSHGDYIDMVMERPMILSPEVDASDIQVLDPETHEVVGTFEGEYGEDSTWVMPGLSDIDESTVTFEQFLEDGMYLGEVLVDGDMQPVKVDHSDMNEKDFAELAGLGSEDEAGYFTLHNTFVRPDVAPKNNGVIEFRSESNSDRSYEALLTQKSVMHVYDDVLDLFAERGLSTENALEFREDVKREGLDAELPDGTRLQELYQNELVDVLSEGVRETFSGETPYSMEIVLEGVDQYEDFGDYLDAEFDDLTDFAEYTTSAFEAGVRPERGKFSGEEFEDEYEQFVDWFTDTYEQRVQEYVSDDFEAEDEWDSRNFQSGSERILAAMNEGGPEKTLEVTKRSDNYEEAR